jgi:GGDEF domain-containing protein
MLYKETKMKRMRWLTMLLVVWLTLLFNLERLDLGMGRESPFNLASSVYVLAAATVVLFLVVPPRRSYLYLASAAILGAYAAFKGLQLSSFFTGIHKYLTITEIVALLVTIGLSWLVSLALREFRDAVEAISMPEGQAQLLSYDKVQERIHAEMGRARRHQRPISVAMIELDPSTFDAALHQAVRDAQAAMIERYVQVRLGVFLSKNVRGTDVVAHQPEGGRFLLLAPETPAEQTNGMLRRLAREVENQMGIRFRYSIADFPNTALTSEELLRKVSEDLQRGGIDVETGLMRPYQSANGADGARQPVSMPVVQEEHVL